MSLGLFTRYGLTRANGGGGGGAAFVASFENAASSGTTLTVTLSDVQEGDLLIGFLTSTSQPANTPPPAPSGWTLIDNYSVGTGFMKAGAYYRIADGTETSVVFTFAIFSAGNPKAHVRQYRPGAGLAYDANPIDDVATVKNATSLTDLVAPAVTTTVDGAVVTYAWLAGNSGGTWTPPTLDDPVDQRSANSQGYSGDLTVASAGAAPTPTLSGSSSTTFKMLVSVAIKPPS